VIVELVSRPMTIHEAIEKAAQRAAECAVKEMLAQYIPPTTEWLNTPQAAIYTKFSEEYLEILRHRDDGSGPPFFKHPRAVRYRRTDLDAWMASFPQGGADPRPLAKNVPRPKRVSRAPHLAEN